MARPTKQGVDYFPLDVHLDNKFKFVEIKYGIEGFGIVVKIMQNIYSQGYWAQWGEDEQLLFAGEHRIDYDKLADVTNECIKRGVFNKDLYEKHEILTSNGIQKRYKEIVRRRKDVQMTEEYKLVDGIFGVNDDINPASGRNDDGKSTQSKVKETKGEDIKEETDDDEESDSQEKTKVKGPLQFTDNQSAAIRSFSENISIASPIVIDSISKWVEDFEDQGEIVIAAIKIAAINSARTWSYVESILKDWSAKNVKSLEDAKRIHEERQRQQEKNPSGNKKSKLAELDAL